MNQRYVALLRGINVGKAKRVAMADLRAVIENLGYDDVKTLLATGNVVFTGQPSETGIVANAIQAAVLEKSGVDSNVRVLLDEEFRQIVEENPFNSDDIDPSTMLISVFLHKGLRDDVADLAEQDWGREGFHVGTLASYTHSPGGILESQSLKAVDRRLGQSVTTRNRRTLDKLRAIL